MIHIVNCFQNGCSSLCAIPKMACDACGKVCEGCEPACNALANSCTSCTEVWDRPLGGYVLLSWWFGLCILGSGGFSVYKFKKEDLDTCEISEEDDQFGLGDSVGLKNWLFGQMGFALIHMVHSLYVQNCLWKKLKGEMESVGSVGAIQADKVKEFAVEVFLYDIVVCAYFFIFLAAYGWSLMGVGWTSGDNCHVHGGWTQWAASLGSSFFWLTLVFFFIWHSTLRCCGAAESIMPPTMYATPQQAAARLETASGSSGEATNSPPVVMPPGAPAGAPAQQSMGEPMNPAASSTTYPGSTNTSGCMKCIQPKQLAKLVACIGIDLMGDASYLLPGIGEGTDFAFAPAEALALRGMFQANGLMVLGLLEELCPFTDLLPLATIAWFLETFLPDHPLSRMLGIGRAGRMGVPQ